LARLLLAALRLESPTAEGANVLLALGISQSELALLVGASRPKVNVALTLLQEMGAIARNGSKPICNTKTPRGHC
jgi:CRP-like cAMP-binding protein